MDLRQELLNLPKVELHRHLEGSLRLNTIKQIAKKYNINLPTYKTDRLKPLALVLKQMNTLKEVLDKFEIARSCFVNKEAIEELTYTVCIDASRENIKLLELRYSPDYIATPIGYKFDVIMESILNGVKRAEKESDITVGIIIICTRDLGIESARRTLDFALSCKDEIIGVDLAGDEAAYPPDIFAKYFKSVKDKGLKVTVHSGEVSGPENILTSLNYLGATRIGHGVQIVHNSDIMEKVIELNIPLELCPTSNYITKAVNKLEEHPLKFLYDRGVKVTINSDDPGIFGIDLTNEYLVCIDKLGFSINEIKQTILNSLDSSFINEEKKLKIKDKYFKDFI